MATVEDQSFMLACLKMARTYVNIVSQELSLYASRPGHEPMQADFGGLKKSIEERIALHTSRLERARRPVVLKQRPSSPTVVPKKPDAVKRPKLKKRAV